MNVVISFGAPEIALNMTDTLKHVKLVRYIDSSFAEQVRMVELLKILIPNPDERHAYSVDLNIGLAADEIVDKVMHDIVLSNNEVTELQTVVAVLFNDRDKSVVESPFAFNARVWANRHDIPIYLASTAYSKRHVDE